jgi:hypothetical protein
MTMARFQTVIKRARFVYSPYASAEMQVFAQVLADSIRARIQCGQNIYDQAAAPLKPGLSGRRGYPDYKAARGLQSVRDGTRNGHTLRCLKVLTANENRAEPRVPAVCLMPRSIRKARIQVYAPECGSLPKSPSSRRRNRAANRVQSWPHLSYQ